jgi:hypothetical protein
MKILKLLYLIFILVPYAIIFGIIIAITAFIEHIIQQSRIK